MVDPILNIDVNSIDSITGEPDDGEKSYPFDNGFSIFAQDSTIDFVVTNINQKPNATDKVAFYSDDECTTLLQTGQGSSYSAIYSNAQSGSDHEVYVRFESVVDDFSDCVPSSRTYFYDNNPPINLDLQVQKKTDDICNLQASTDQSFDYETNCTNLLFTLDADDSIEWCAGVDDCEIPDDETSITYASTGSLTFEKVVSNLDPVTQTFIFEDVARNKATLSIPTIKTIDALPTITLNTSAAMK